MGFTNIEKGPSGEPFQAPGTLGRSTDDIGSRGLPRIREHEGTDMAQTLTSRKRLRKKFGSIGEVAEMPNLIEVQKASYDDFLMVQEPPGGRSDN